MMLFDTSVKKGPRPIVIVSNSTCVGGEEYNTLKIIEQLHDWRYPLYLIAGSKGALFKDFQSHTKDQCIVNFPYPGKIKSWAYYFSFLKKMKIFLSQIQGSIHFFVGNFYQLWSILKLKRYFPSSIFSTMWQGEFEFNNNSCMNKWIRYGANEADCLIAAEPVAAAMNASHLLRHKVLSLNPRSRYLDETHTAPTKKEAREALRWDSNEKIAICIGRIGSGKGQPWLVESFLNHTELYGKWRLVIVGPMSEEDKPIWDNLLKKDRHQKISLLGSRNDIPTLLAAADLALFPSLLNESFGLSVLEAAAMNVPLLTFNVGAIPYTLTKDYPGIVDRHQPEKFIHTWNQLNDHSLNALQLALPKKHVENILSKVVWKNALQTIFNKYD